VQEFYDSRETDGAAIRAACMARGKEQQRRPQPFSASAEQVRRDLRNRRKRSFALARKFLLDKSEIVADQIKNLFDRQQGDGVSPKLFISLET
jgi:hypothetical protein